MLLYILGPPLVAIEGDETMTIKNINDLDTALDGFYKKRDTASSEIQKLEVSTRAKLYAMLGEASKLAEQLLDPALADVLARALTLRQIPQAAPGDNPYLPIVRMLFGRFDTAADKVDYLGVTNIKFVQNRSAEKYANVLRWFRDNAVTKDFVKRIEGFAGKPGKMDGIIAADRAAHAAKPPYTDAEVADLVRGLVEVRSLGTEPVTISDGASKADGFAAVWGRYEGGKFIPMGHFKYGDEVERFVQRLAVSKADELRREREEAEVRQRQEELQRTLDVYRDKFGALEQQPEPEIA